VGGKDGGVNGGPRPSVDGVHRGGRGLRMLLDARADVVLEGKGMMMMRVQKFPVWNFTPPPPPLLNHRTPRSVLSTENWL
jgi:hypothetical protein